MIRKTLILLCVCAASAFLSCAKAPEPAKLLYVMAEVTCASGNGTALVTVKKGSSSGETVSGAAVTINSQRESEGHRIHSYTCIPFLSQGSSCL